MAGSPGDRRTHGSAAGLGYRYAVPLARRLLPESLRLAVRALVALPPRIAWFYVRAARCARRHGDTGILMKSVRPEDLSALLKAAGGRRHVVELGTGGGWSAIALLMAEPERRVISYDPVPPPPRYLGLADAQTRSRLTLRQRGAQAGPEAGDPPVELLFVDIQAHTKETTVQALTVWRGSLSPDALVALHDYGPDFPGVAEAVATLRLDGEVLGHTLFVCPGVAGSTVTR